MTYSISTFEAASLLTSRPQNRIAIPPRSAYMLTYSLRM